MILKVFFEIHLPKTKLMTVVTFYQPLNQTNFIKTLNENFAKQLRNLNSGQFQYKFVP